MSKNKKVTGFYFFFTLRSLWDVYKPSQPVRSQ